MTITWTNEKRKLSDLIPWPRNPRTITDAQAERLTTSVEDFGQVEALAISPTNDIYNGHQRLSVLAGQYGMDHEVDVRVSSRPLTEKERERLTVYLHRGATGDWDFEKLAREFDTDELFDWGFDPDDFEGFDFGSPGVTGGEGKDTEPEVNRAEELQRQYGTELGQTWGIGEHRLVIGDCTDADVVGRLMGGENAEICFTSPPYLEMREYSGSVNDIEKLLKFIPLSVDFSDYQVVNLGLKFTDGQVVSYWNDYLARFAECNRKLLAWNVWHKMQSGSIASATNMFFLVHEWIFVFGEKAKRLNRTVPNDLDDYERRHGKDFLDGITRRVRQRDGSVEDTSSSLHTHHQIHSVLRQRPELGQIRESHPATFPVGLPTQYIEAMTNELDIVYDPFAGSGTTGIACANLNRQARMIEISPAYGAVILHRMAEHLGVEPELINS